jgi:hypothetical protein
MAAGVVVTVAVIILAKRRVTALATATATGAATAHNTGEPSANAPILAAAGLNLGFVVFVRVGVEGKAWNRAGRPDSAAGPNRRASAHERTGLGAVDRWRPHGGASVSKKGVHILEADTTGLGVDEVHCRKS